jgi:recombination protein RecR
LQAPSFSPLIDELIKALRCLPGVGHKSAQRMVFHLLERNRDGGKNLGTVLDKAMRDIKHCNNCRTLSEIEICRICANPQRDLSKLCVVETPADVFALEQTSDYNGLYFVLMGRLSPLDRIGPEDLGLELFRTRLGSGVIKEVIMATNPTVEGEATAFYLAEITKQFKIPTTKLAHGIPMGGELEYLDAGTLTRALAGRGLI